MDNVQIPSQDALPNANAELETALQALLKAQLSLNQNVSSTSEFLRFVLALANENLGTIRSQLELIRDLATGLEEGHAP